MILRTNFKMALPPALKMNIIFNKRVAPPMIVCLCEAVSDSDLRAAVDSGSRTVKQVADSCRGAGTDCGACCQDILEIIKTSSKSSYRRIGSASRLVSAR